MQTRSLRSTLTASECEGSLPSGKCYFPGAGEEVLSPFRDADVRLEAFDELLSRTAQRPEHFAPLRDLLLGGDQRDTPKALEEQFSVTAQEARAAEERLKKADLPNEPGFQLIESGLCQSYRRGRQAVTGAYDEGEETAFHEKPLHHRMPRPRD